VTSPGWTGDVAPTGRLVDTSAEDGFMRFSVRTFALYPHSTRARAARQS
jgi:hypothetical protein